MNCKLPITTEKLKMTTGFLLSTVYCILTSVFCFFPYAPHYPLYALRYTFLQNKANLRCFKAKNADFNEKQTQTNPISKPIQSQFAKCPKMNVNSVLTKDYQNLCIQMLKKQSRTNPISKPASLK